MKKYIKSKIDHDRRDTHLSDRDMEKKEDSNKSIEVQPSLPSSPYTDENVQIPNLALITDIDDPENESLGEVSSKALNHGTAINFVLSNAPVMEKNYSTLASRYYARGSCVRNTCKFRHEIDTSQLDPVYTFCHDFQNNEYIHENCRYVHGTESQQENYFRNGEISPRAFAHQKKNPLMMPPPVVSPPMQPRPPRPLLPTPSLRPPPPSLLPPPPSLLPPSPAQCPTQAQINIPMMFAAAPPPLPVIFNRPSPPSRYKPSSASDAQALSHVNHPLPSGTSTNKRKWPGNENLPGTSYDPELDARSKQKQCENCIYLTKELEFKTEKINHMQNMLEQFLKEKLDSTHNVSTPNIMNQEKSVASTSTGVLEDGPNLFSDLVSSFLETAVNEPATLFNMRGNVNPLNLANVLLRVFRSILKHGFPEGNEELPITPPP